MKDTSIEMEQRFRSMILARSGEDRLKMGCSMHETGASPRHRVPEGKDPQSDTERFTTGHLPSILWRRFR